MQAKVIIATGMKPKIVCMYPKKCTNVLDYVISQLYWEKAFLACFDCLIFY